MKRALSIVVAIIVLMLLVRAVQPNRHPPAVDAAQLRKPLPGDGHRTVPNPTAPDPGYTQAQVDAMTDATDVVHRYLQTAAQGKWDEANALWVGGRAPSTTDESGLRTLLPAKVVRIRNDAPELKGTTGTPARVEVPVRVTLTANDGRPYVFTGQYRVERTKGDAAWRLSRAELHAELDRP